MARVQYTFTFTNAQPGSSVHFGPQGVKVYSSATDTTEDGPNLVLDASNAVTVWSDAGILSAHTVDGRGEEISATATHAAPTVTTDDGTAGSSPFAGGTSDTPASGNVVVTGQPAGLEFAFWGYNSNLLGQYWVALRVTAGPLDVSDWYNQAYASLEAGFNAFDYESDTADPAALQTGEYVAFNLGLPTTTDVNYANKVAGWGFDPRSFLPSWQPCVVPASSLVTYDPTVSGLAAPNVKSALDEIVARIDALENP